MPNRDSLSRIIYISRSCSPETQQAADVAAILASARAHNTHNGVTGLLVVANGHYLQLLEGPAAAVDATFERIREDPRHHELTVLAATATRTATFASWSMGLVERSEPASATAARHATLRERLGKDTSVDVADFFRLTLAPNVNAQGPAPERRRRPVCSVAFASPTAMWSAGVLQHIAGQSMVRVGRTNVTDPADQQQRVLLEYVDVELPHAGPVRALGLNREPSECAPVAPLMERLSLLVFMLSTSDIAQFADYARGWIAMAQLRDSGTPILIVANLAPERLTPVLNSLRASTELPVTHAKVRLSDAAGVWAAARAALHDAAASGPLPRRPAHDTKAGAAEALPPSGARLDIPLPLAPPEPAPAPDAFTAAATAFADSGCLEELLDTEGALQAAVLKIDPPAVLLALPHATQRNSELLAAAEFLGPKSRLVMRLAPDTHTDDITICTRDRLEIFRPLRHHPGLFLALTLDRARIELAVARMKVQEVESALDLLPITAEPQRR